VQPSTPTSSWNSHPTQPELPADVVVTHAFESADVSESAQVHAHASFRMLIRTRERALWLWG
jgi:hypothetical protein